MSNQLVSRAPASLISKIFETVADLAQFEDSLLPEGARAVVLNHDSGASSGNTSGMREFIFSRQPPPASPALNFVEENGALATPTGNAYKSKAGYLWVQWPQQYLIQLNAATPVAVADVITVLGGAVSQNTQIDW